MLFLFVFIDDLVAYSALGRTSIALNRVWNCLGSWYQILAVGTDNVIWNVFILGTFILLLCYGRLLWLSLRHLADSSTFILCLYKQKIVNLHLKRAYKSCSSRVLFAAVPSFADWPPVSNLLIVPTTLGRWSKNSESKNLSHLLAFSLFDLDILFLFVEPRLSETFLPWTF